MNEMHMYNKISFDRRLRQPMIDSFTKIEESFIDSFNELLKMYHGNVNIIMTNIISKFV